MLFVSVSHPDQFQSIPVFVGGVELRLDLFPDPEAKITLPSGLRRPVMLTVRRESHGGKFKGTEEEREALIERLLKREPPFFDLEWDMRPAFLAQVLPSHPKTKFVLSYHNFNETPEALEEVYRSMSQYPAFTYKIAAVAHSTLDALRMLLFAKKHPGVSAVCMGEKGEFARVLAPIVGNQVNYACIDEKSKTAPGQLTAEELVLTYGYQDLNRDTAIYGLIGDPVRQSSGHIYHNKVFGGSKRVYVKMILREWELAQFFPMAKELGFKGLSVTMPLKEKVLPFLDEIDPIAQQIGAVNTVVIADKIIGTNTDGKGALDAIEKRVSVKGKKVVLLGAGGAARAIAFEAKSRGAEVFILNRTVERAKKLAQDVGGFGGSLSEVPDYYDILINTAPDFPSYGKVTPLETALVMNIASSAKYAPYFPDDTVLKYKYVPGQEMFLNQAAAQSALWLSK